MTSFQKCLALAILGSQQPAFLRSLAHYARVNEDVLGKWLELFRRPCPETKLNYGSAEVELYYCDIFDGIKAFDDNDEGKLFGKLAPLPVQLQVALHLADNFPPLFTKDRGRSYINVGHFLLVQATTKLKSNKYANSRHLASKLIACLKVLFSQWQKQLDLIDGWESYEKVVLEVPTTREMLFNIKPVLLGAFNRKLPWERKNIVKNIF